MTIFTNITYLSIISHCHLVSSPQTPKETRSFFPNECISCRVSSLVLLNSTTEWLCSPTKNTNSLHFGCRAKRTFSTSHSPLANFIHRSIPGLDQSSVDYLDEVNLWSERNATTVQVVICRYFVYCCFRNIFDERSTLYDRNHATR